MSPISYTIMVLLTPGNYKMWVGISFPSCSEAFCSASHNQKQQLVRWMTNGQKYSLYGTDLSSELFKLTLLVSLSKHPHSEKTAQCVSLQDCVRQRRGLVAPIACVHFLPLSHVSMLSSKMPVPRFQFPHLFPHLHKVVGRTEVVDIYKTLRKMHDPWKMCPSLCSSGAWWHWRSPWRGPVHTHWSLLAQRNASTFPSSAWWICGVRKFSKRKMEHIKTYSTHCDTGLYHIIVIVNNYWIWTSAGVGASCVSFHWIFQ